jgi:hypothetical protein
LTLGAAVAACGLLGGVAVASQAGSADARPTTQATSKAKTSFTFVDKIARGKQEVAYTLPSLPPGPYAVSLFAGLEPADSTVAGENLYCEVNDTTARSRILVASVRWTGQDATFATASSVARIRSTSNLRVFCGAEHGLFTHGGSPLRVNFVRLDRLKAAAIEPDYTYPPD